MSTIYVLPNPTALATSKLVTTVTRFGATLPKAVLDAIDTAQRMAGDARQLKSADGLNDAVFAALRSGRDPAGDPHVQREVAAKLLADNGMVNRVLVGIDNDLATTVSAQVDAIIDTWRKPFATAAAQIATCHEQIGDLRLDQSAEILKQGGNVGALWSTACNAVATIAEIDAAWVLLAQITRFAPSGVLDVKFRMGSRNVDGVRFRLLRIAAATPEQWAASGLEHRKTADAWDAQIAGFDLSIANGDEFAHRIAAVTTPMVNTGSDAA